MSSQQLWTALQFFIACDACAPPVLENDSASVFDHDLLGSRHLVEKNREPTFMGSQPIIRRASENILVKYWDLNMIGTSTNSAVHHSIKFKSLEPTPARDHVALEGFNEQTKINKTVP